jgi:hypothetical protein
MCWRKIYFIGANGFGLKKASANKMERKHLLWKKTIIRLSTLNLDVSPFFFLLRPMKDGRTDHHHVPCHPFKVISIPPLVLAATKGAQFSPFALINTERLNINRSTFLHFVLRRTIFFFWFESIDEARFHGRYMKHLRIARRPSR